MSWICWFRLIYLTSWNFNKNQRKKFERNRRNATRNNSNVYKITVVFCASECFVVIKWNWLTWGRWWYAFFYISFYNVRVTCWRPPAHLKLISTQNSPIHCRRVVHKYASPCTKCTPRTVASPRIFFIVSDDNEKNKKIQAIIRILSTESKWLREQQIFIDLNNKKVPITWSKPNSDRQIGLINWLFRRFSVCFNDHQF